MAFVRRPNVQIAYEVRGRGVPVLFVQGVGLAGCAWGPQISALSADHRCIALDNRGVGKSLGDTRGLSVDLMARDAFAVLDQLEVERAHLVGHSLGGVIIQRMALLSAARALSLSFLCTFAGGRDLASPSARLIWFGARSRLGTRSMRRRAFARLVMPDAYIAALGIERVIADLEQAFDRNLADPPAISDVQLRALRRHDERDELARLGKIPSLVLSGRLDPIASHAANAALAHALGDAPHRVWEDASHALPIQHAAAINAALREHIRASV